jgi:hypothetical protein
VSRDFIVKGVQRARLEYRHGAIWGNPYLRILRSQLEKNISEEPGEDYLANVKSQTELRRINRELSDLQKKVNALQEWKCQLEELCKKQRSAERLQPGNAVPAGLMPGVMQRKTGRASKGA